MCSIFKILSTYICWKKYIKCKIWRVAVRPSYIEDAWFLKVKVWPHSLAEQTQISILSKSRVSNIFGQMLQPLLWSGLPATNVKMTTSAVSSLLNYGAIFIWRIIYKSGSRQRVGHPWSKTRDQPRRTIIRLLAGQSENNGSNPVRGRECFATVRKVVSWIPFRVSGYWGSFPKRWNGRRAQLSQSSSSSAEG